jgi:hypothetical protein
MQIAWLAAEIVNYFYFVKIVKAFKFSQTHKKNPKIPNLHYFFL